MEVAGAYYTVLFHYWQAGVTLISIDCLVDTFERCRFDAVLTVVLHECYILQVFGPFLIDLN